MAEQDAAPRALTAAEKRAARRARVLQGGDLRMKLVTGEIASLKKEDASDALERAMDAGVKELLDATELDDGAPTVTAASDSADENSANNNSGGEAAASSTLKIPPRVDPAQRRRDAAARRKKKEAIVEELLGRVPSAPVTANTGTSADQVFAETSAAVQRELSITEKKVEPAFSRHTIALRLQSAEEKLILFVLFGTAVYLAVTTDLRNVTTDMLTSDPLFLSYKHLFSKGVSLDSIRQQMQRENLDPTMIDQIERLFVSQRKSESASNVSFARSLVPNLLDLPGFFTSLLYHPPIVICVLLLRVLVGLLGRAVHSALALPDVKKPQDDDLGFVVNLVLSSRPAFKGYVVKARKSMDDIFVFLWVFVLVVAVRAIATTPKL